MARGTWTGSGTWQTSGGGGGGTAAVAGGTLLVLGAAAWAAPRLAWLAVITAACLVLSVVLALFVVPRLARWSDERDAAAYPAQEPDQLRAEPVRPVGPPERPAIAPQVVNFNFYGADAARAAAVIRQAIPGKDE